jgi:hypothetical protein
VLVCRIAAFWGHRGNKDNNPLIYCI